MGYLPDPLIQEFTTGAAGTIAAGAVGISIYNSGGLDGTFNGGAVRAGTSKSYFFIGRPYGAFDYNAVGTSFDIIVFR